MSNQAPRPLDVLARAGASLESVQRQLEHTDRLATLGTLAAGVAHEINNILTPALGYVQMAQARPDDPDLAVKALDRAASCLASVSAITDAILGFSRRDVQESVTDAGEYPNIYQTVEATLACMARDPARDGIRLVVDIQGDAAVRIRPVALQQILLNLLLNACAAVDPPGGEVLIGAIERSDGTTRITVEDNGPGIPEEVRQSLFQPFVSTRASSVHGTRLGQAGGTGLGLTVSRYLVEEAGGRIDVESSQPHGTRFVITLPTAPPDAKSKAG